MAQAAGTDASARGRRHYDVIVAGGGASGLIAAVAAARLGARTLLVEKHGCLGGTATSAYVAQYLGFFHGERQAVFGLPLELAERIVAAGGSAGFASYTMGEAAAVPLVVRHFPFNPEVVKIVADELAADAGVDVLFHARTTGAHLDGGRVAGITAHHIGGHDTFSADAVVDATGDAVVAHGAGVPMLEDEERRQPNTLCFRLSNVDVQQFRALGRNFKRERVLAGIERGELYWQSISFVSTPAGTDAICLMSRIVGRNSLDFVDASEQERIGRAQIKTIVGFLKREIPGFENAILCHIAAQVGTRETRRIEGRHLLTADDIFAGRTYRDAIALGVGPMDVHEQNGTGIKLEMPPSPFEIPLAAMLPRDVDGLVVTGRAISATHDANSGARHMATAMSLGQAAGVTAALRSRAGAMPDGDAVRAALRGQGAVVSLDDLETVEGSDRTMQQAKEA